MVAVDPQSAHCRGVHWLRQSKNPRIAQMMLEKGVDARTA
jgi:hypothetical protein